MTKGKYHLTVRPVGNFLYSYILSNYVFRTQEEQQYLTGNDDLKDRNGKVYCAVYGRESQMIPK